MATSTLPLIDVDRLQLGMYIVLDVGWRNHPFLRSSFLLRNPEQLEQLRELGLQQVRYDPERSNQGPLEIEVDAAPGAVSRVVVETTPWPETEPPTAEQWQHESLQRIEAEYTQIADQHQKLLKQLTSDPQAARELAEQISETVFHTVADCDQPTVRLLSQRVGPQASGHEIGVAALALLLGRDCNLSADSLHHLSMAALLHDIGKSRLPSVLHKDHSRLTDLERHRYRQHVELGVELAMAMKLPDAVVHAIAEHHEHRDGSGFPAALRNEQISPGGSILAITNRYMDLICPSHTEPGLTPHQALQQMYSGERARFDPYQLSRFIRLLGVYPPGSLVQLSDQRMAIVVSARPGESLAPRIQILEHPDDESGSEEFDLQPNGDLRVRRSLPPGQLKPAWAQRARQLARTAIYIESQTAPEWRDWGITETQETRVY